MFATNVKVLKRGGIGFVTGFICAIAVLVFLDWLPPGHDLGLLEQERQTRCLWLATAIASGAAIFAMFAATWRISEFWLWFAVAFGAIAVIPVGQFSDGSLVPLGVCYVNTGFQRVKPWVFGINVSAALVTAAIIHWTRRNSPKDLQKDPSSPQSDGLDQ